MKKVLTKISLSLLVVVIGLLLSGILYQFINTTLDNIWYPAPGSLVDVGGYKLHINCNGTGKPTVILGGGTGSGSSSWSLVQPEVAKFAHVCSYDRAGHGWSDASPFPRTAKVIVE